MSTPGLPFSPACERNKHPIWEVLRQALPGSGTVLEIGSGTGQHVVHFAAQRPELLWQPSDRPDYMPGLLQRLQREGGSNILPPITLDVLETWPAEDFDAVYSANTSHIMGWQAVCAMFAGVASRLRRGGVFCLYGPFNEQGRFTAPSNAAFDAQLRCENPQMGLRDVEAVEALASGLRISLVRKFPLPANNQILLFEKDADDQ